MNLSNYLPQTNQIMELTILESISLAEFYDEKEQKWVPFQDSAPMIRAQCPKCSRKYLLLQHQSRICPCDLPVDQIAPV